MTIYMLMISRDSNNNMYNSECKCTVPNIETSYYDVMIITLIRKYYNIQILYKKYNTSQIRIVSSLGLHHNSGSKKNKFNI